MSNVALVCNSGTDRFEKKKGYSNVSFLSNAFSYLGKIKPSIKYIYIETLNLILAIVIIITTIAGIGGKSDITFAQVATSWIKIVSTFSPVAQRIRFPCMLRSLTFIRPTLFLFAHFAFYTKKTHPNPIKFIGRTFERIVWTVTIYTEIRSNFNFQIFSLARAKSKCSNRKKRGNESERKREKSV